ncbi:uncharacterized protein LOC119769474 [Culex quinquefasciatus]|uniref:uncharacterized protein LOC119769474 n=1 Tax=Culex quinquefasciatus TaxID=7176 RepID=UPI0018E2A9D1|nr:uncharacterized protein LOC119769474 [Culex quinquefasciatus]
MNVKPNILELMNPREHARNRNDEPEPFFGSLSMVYQVTRKRGRINKVGKRTARSSPLTPVTGWWCPGRKFATCRRRCASGRPCTLMRVRPFKQHGYRGRTKPSGTLFGRLACRTCLRRLSGTDS